MPCEDVIRGAAAGLAACTLLLLPATAEAQALFDDSSVYVFGGLSFPAAADSFAAMEATRWPQPELGTQVQYRTPLDPSARIDVYVYPTKDHGLEREFEVAVEGIRVYAERNRDGVSAVVDTTHSVTVTDGDGRIHTGWLVVGRFIRGDDQRQTVMYVFEKDGRYLKYRLTHNPALRARLEPRIQRFLAETLGGIGR